MIEGIILFCVYIELDLAHCFNLFMHGYLPNNELSGPEIVRDTFKNNS